MKYQLSCILVMICCWGFANDAAAQISEYQGTSEDSWGATDYSSRTPSDIEQVIASDSLVLEEPPVNAEPVMSYDWELEPVDCVEECVEECADESVQFGDWLGYNATESDTTWIAGNADDFGIFSLESYPTLPLGKQTSLALGTGLHFLNGPVNTDMPPRLFDLYLASRTRKVWSPNFISDVRVGVGAFTDFEGSVRKGIRFPGHAVGYYQWDSWLISVLGVEVLDRDDVSVLPVAGVVWRPRQDLIFELVFPRPKIQVQLNDDCAFYVSGELGGGTWAIERSNGTNDNATYRDLRLVLGVMEFDDDDTALELGWTFARELEYRSGIGNYRPDDTFMLRFRSHF